MPRTGAELGVAMQKETLIRIGNGNFVIASRIVAILNPASSPMRRLREDAKKEGRLIDATQGKKTRAIIVLDSNHVLLSSVGAETISQRIFMSRQESSAQDTAYLSENNEDLNQ